MLSIEPVDKLSRTNTSSPRSSSASDRCEPTKPAPPVIRTRINYIPHSRFHRGDDPDPGILRSLRGAAVRGHAQTGHEVPASAREITTKLLIIQDSMEC